MTFAILFESVGVGEWFVLLAVILVVVGPRRLPSAARKFGNTYAKFRRAAESFKRQLLDLDLEVDRAVAEAERQANEALTVEEDVPADPGPTLPPENVVAAQTAETAEAAMEANDGDSATQRS